MYNYGDSVATPGTLFKLFCNDVFGIIKDM